MNTYNLVEKIRVTTPACRLQYPKLIEPDTKFTPEGAYKVTCVLDAGDATEIADQLDQLLARHKESLKAQAPSNKFKLADLPWAFEEYDGKPSFVIKTKMKAKGIDRDGRPWSTAPALFDAKGAPVRDRESLRGMWSGTIGKVSFEACPFFQAAIGAGITLRLRAVQVITLVENSGNAEGFGFGEEAGWTPTSGSATPFDATGTTPEDGFDF